MTALAGSSVVLDYDDDGNLIVLITVYHED